MAEHFDVVVVGGGPGGYAAALYGANAGLNIAVVEKEKVGGTCLHRGCIPAKEFLETASVFRTVAGAKEFGVLADQPGIDFGASQARKQKVVDGLWKGLQGLMKSRKITTIKGTGSLTRGKLVKVDDGTELQGEHVVLASGLGAAHAARVRNRRPHRDELRRGARPRRAAVIGRRRGRWRHRV